MLNQNLILSEKSAEMKNKAMNNYQLIDETYIDNREHPHTSFIHSKYLQCEKGECYDVLKMKSGFFGVIQDQMVTTMGKPKIEGYTLNTDELFKSINSSGFVGIEKNLNKDGEEVLEVVPSDELFPDYETGELVRAFHLNKKTEFGLKWFLFVRRYTDNTVTNHLYNVDSGTSFAGTETTLDEHPDTELMPELLNTAGPTFGIITGTAYIETNKDKIYAIERLMMETHINSIKFGSVKMHISGADKENVVWDNDTLYTEKDVSMEYVSKPSTDIDSSQKEQDSLTIKVSASTNVPLKKFGLDPQANGSSGVAVIMQKADLKNYVNNIREQIDMLVMELFKVGIVWREINDETTTERLEIITQMETLGLISETEKYMRFYGESEEDAKKHILKNALGISKNENTGV